MDVVLEGVHPEARHRIWTIICCLDELKARMVEEENL